MNRPPLPRTATWLVALTTIGLALWLLGHSSLATPPLAPAHWAAWAARRDPLTAAMAILRVVALVVTAYLWVTTALHLAASTSRSSLLHALAATVTVPAARRLLGSAAGLGLSAAVVLAPVAAGSPHRGGPAGSGSPATMHEVTPPPSGPSVPPTTGAAGRPDAPAGAQHVASEHELPPSTTTIVTPASPHPSTTPPPSAPAVPSTAATPPGAGAPSTTAPQGNPAPADQRSFPALGPPAPTETWTVAPGDNFWFEAEQVLARAWGRSPSDAEIVPYWRTLIEANRAALADPANPDLIFPGQRFNVPPPPPA